MLLGACELLPLPLSVLDLLGSQFSLYLRLHETIYVQSAFTGIYLCVFLPFVFVPLSDRRTPLNVSFNVAGLLRTFSLHRCPSEQSMFLPSSLNGFHRGKPLGLAGVPLQARRPCSSALVMTGPLLPGFQQRAMVCLVCSLLSCLAFVIFLESVD